MLFLAEAFTRPKVMYRLAKLGFTQSYTYFTWRNTKEEITHYFTELTRSRSAGVFPSQPLAQHTGHPHEYLQFGGRPAFMARLVLAATLGAQLRHLRPGLRTAWRRKPREPGSEEYLDSEKYQIRQWDTGHDRKACSDFIARVNRIRRENPPLHAGLRTWSSIRWTTNS